MAASNPTTLTPIASESAFHDAVSQLPPTCLAVIYFHAPWAEPCRQMSTILTTLASTYSQSTPPIISFLSLDAEEVSDISEEYDVSQVPFVVLQKDGKVLERVTGTDAGKVRSAVERHAGSGSGNAGGVGLPPAQKVTKTQGSGGDVDMGNSGQADGGMAKYAPGANDEASAPSKEELDTRLSELVKAAPVMLFMKGTPSAPQCGFSRQTVSILREKGVRYGFFNILADDEVRQGLKEYSDWPTFPQVYVGGELIGGLDIVSLFILHGCWEDANPWCSSRRSLRTMQSFSRIILCPREAQVSRHERWTSKKNELMPFLDFNDTRSGWSTMWLRIHRLVGTLATL